MDNIVYNIKQEPVDIEFKPYITPPCADNATPYIDESPCSITIKQEQTTQHAVKVEEDLHLALTTISPSAVCDPIYNKLVPFITNEEQHEFKDEPDYVDLHSVDGAYQCLICHNWCNTKTALQHHIELHTEETQYKYTSFSQTNSLTEHTYKHTAEKPYECDICHKRFAQKIGVRRHMSIHTGEKPHKCDICHKRFANKSALIQHQSIHTEQNLHECNICHKRFAQKSVFTLHMRIHTGEKPHECNICHKRFAQKSALIRHMTIHTGEKPHECNICHKRFSQKIGLTRHMCTHTGERPHECNICHDRFARKSNLTRHEHIHR